MPIWVPAAKLMIRAGVARRVPSIRRLLGDGVDYLKYYSDRILGSPNVELKATQAMLDKAQPGVIDLSLGAPPLDRRLLAMSHEMKLKDDGYPSVSGCIELRQAIARKLETENGLTVDPNGEVLVTNGVSQAIGLVLDSFINRRETVAMFDPTFFIYRLAAQNRGARVAMIPSWLEGGRTRFKEMDVRRAMRRARILFINSPANPTGGVFEADDLERIAYWARRRDVLIFSDEVYERFLYEGRHLGIAQMKGAAGRTLTASGFSKSHGMAGHRVGYVAGPRHLIQPMIVSALATSPFVSVASQQLALLALSQPASSFGPTLAEFRKRRELLDRVLSEAGFGHDVPAGAFYFWMSVKHLGLNGAEFARRLLSEDKTLVLPGESAGPSGVDSIRISYAGDNKALEEGARRIASFTRRLQEESPSIPMIRAGRQAKAA